jgi:hypothetical protein
MGKIKREEAQYVDQPNLYTFKSTREKEIMLNRNFTCVNKDIDNLIKSLLTPSTD